MALLIIVMLFSIGVLTFQAEIRKRKIKALEALIEIKDRDLHIAHMTPEKKEALTTLLKSSEQLRYGGLSAFEPTNWEAKHRPIQNKEIVEAIATANRKQQIITMIMNAPMTNTYDISTALDAAIKGADKVLESLTPAPKK